MLRQICLAVYLLAAKPIIGIRSAAGSKTAQEQHLREVMDRHGSRILRLAYSYVHNMQDAEEILQDTLIKLISSAPEFESSEHEKAWLLRVAANLAKNRIEYNKLRDTDELKDDLVAEEREDLSFVWEAVKSLPENYREVIHLFYEEGYQTDEIAELLGESGTNIRTRLKRARAKLKEILKEEYDFGGQV
ncbi:MAG: sigma-70 family RNA polymerase sigma factor [Ruminococcus sp.]|nr:sigma-70 family RNA polymerase sigma factor [Ruminococcus sp.]